MTRLIALLAALLAVGLPSLAYSQAIDRWSGNPDAATAAPPITRPGAVAYYTWNSSSATGFTGYITTTVPSSLYFLSDINSGTLVAGAEIELWFCRKGASVNPTGGDCQQLIVDITGGGIGPADDLTMNGDNGATANQRAWIADIPPGIWQLRLTQAPDAGEVAQAWFFGHSQ